MSHPGFNIEVHPVMHYGLILLFYNLGLLVNVLGQVFATMVSKSNGINSIATYFKLRWIPIAARWFICICMFLIVWENPALFSIEKFMPNFAAHLGVAGGIGFLSDAFWDRLLGIIAPGIHRSLPPIPPVPDAANPNTPA